VASGHSSVVCMTHSPVPVSDQRVLKDIAVKYRPQPRSSNLEFFLSNRTKLLRWTIKERNVESRASLRYVEHVRHGCS
jgi:hypothetical protein